MHSRRRAQTHPLVQAVERQEVAIGTISDRNYRVPHIVDPYYILLPAFANRGRLLKCVESHTQEEGNRDIGAKSGALEHQCRLLFLVPFYRRYRGLQHNPIALSRVSDMKVKRHARTYLEDRQP